MSKDITYGKLTDYYFGPITLNWFSDEGVRLTGAPFMIRIENGEHLYTTVSYKTYQVTLGKDFFTKAIAKSKRSDVVDPTTLKHTYKQLSAVYKAGHYHEIGHILYTDMHTFTEMVTLLNDKNQHDLMMLFKTLYNIFEDVVIERELAYDYSNIGKFLKYLRNTLFTQEVIDQFRKDMDDESPDHLIQYLLYRYRKPDRVAFEHKMYADNKKAMHTSAYIVMNTSDPKKRVERALAFAYELYMFIKEEKEIDYREVLKGKDIAWIQTLPEASAPPSLKAPTSPSPSSISGDGSEVSPVAKPASAKASSKDDDSEDGEDVASDAEDEIEEEIDMGKATHSKPSEDINPSKDPDSDKAINRVLRAASNDEPILNEPHHSVHIKDSKDMRPYRDRYQQIVENNRDKITHLVSIIKKMKAYNTSAMLRGQRKGKLDARAITRPQPTNRIFKQKKLPRQEADLAVQIVGDNSGSMTGLKTRIVGSAIIILQETLERLKIPFEVTAFTEGYNGSVTIDLKRFNDKFSETKYNTCLFSEQVEDVGDLPVFMGNVDEINIDFLYKRFLHERTEKDKLMIVLSDGATTGSRNVLSDVVKRAEAEGIKVLGIGIVDNNVERIYTNNKVFRSMDALEDLAPTLQNYVLKNIFK